MQSATDLSAEKAEFDRLLEFIKGQENLLGATRFLDRLKKYLNHSQRGISFTPSKSVKERLIMVQSLWKGLRTSTAFKDFHENTLNLFDNDAENDFKKLRTYFPKESDDTDELIADISLSSNSVVLPDAKLYVPTEIKSGTITYFNQDIDSPLSAEYNAAMDLYNENKRQDSLNAFLVLLAKLKALPLATIGDHLAELTTEVQIKLATSYSNLGTNNLADKQWVDAIKFYREALLVLEELFVGSHSPEIMTEIANALTTRRQLYQSAINHYIKHLSDVDMEENTLILMNDILQDKKLSPNSKPLPLQSYRLIANTNLNLGKKHSDYDDMDNALQFFNTAIKQINYIMQNFTPEKCDTDLRIRCYKNYFAYLLYLANELFEYKDYPAALSKILRIIGEIKKIENADVLEALASITLESYCLFEKHLLNYLDVNTRDSTFILTAIEDIMNAIKDNETLLFILNKNIAYINVLTAYLKCTGGLWDESYVYLQNFAEKIPLEKVVISPNIFYLPEHNLNDFLSLISILRNYYLPAVSLYTARDMDWALLTERFIGQILLQQVKVFDIDNHDTYLSTIKIIERAHNIFDLIPDEHKTILDIANLQMAKEYWCVIKNSLLVKVENLLFTLRTSLTQQITFFSQNLTPEQLPLYFIVSQLRDMQELSHLRVVNQHLAKYIAENPTVHCLPLLKSIYQAGNTLLELNLIQMIGKPTIAAPVAAPDNASLSIRLNR